MPEITPFEPIGMSPNAKGFLPPLLRALSHITFMLTYIASHQNDTMEVNHDDMAREVEHIKDHWSFVLRPTFVPPFIRDMIQQMTDDITILDTIVQTGQWPLVQAALLTFYQNLLIFSSRMDTEILGLRYPDKTDPGTAL